MDTATLVDEQIDDGQQFIDALKRSGFDVAVAFWAHTTEEGLWFLYIASQVVDQVGLSQAYRAAYSELASGRARWVTRSDIKLIGVHNPIAKEAISYRSGPLITRFHGRTLGNLTVEEAVIYPQ